MQIQSVSLYFSEGSSDKTYQVQLVQTDGGYLVNFQYGRRGSSLTSGSKTPSPVDEAKARKIFDKLVTEKMAKGYTPDVSGTAYQDTPKGELVTGVLPQLLNPVEECGLDDLFADLAWCLQEKYDGERRMVSNVGGEWFGINRKGLRVALPMPVVEALGVVSANTIIDGELIGDVYYAFDILERNGTDLREYPYEDRHDALMREVRALDPKVVVLVDIHVSEDEKREAYALVEGKKGEGVVFKRLRAAYTVGRPSSGGTQLKYKFVESGTFVVDSQNDSKRSVQVAAFDQNGNKVLLGNVSIPPNYDIPSVGDIVEVQYLYAYKGGSLYQPIYRGKRADQSLEDCTLSQLKYKPVAEAA
ncbi:WGR domain-containing protein [Thiobacillus denitrificans]|uniref:ATP-dependent DNA ligase n=1 Tax=Thiobacillus denitrificans TaxID=36861 RepID=UPI0003A62C56|nr:WGR domain-containing protein [Thiobacillus denitrificans]